MTEAKKQLFTRRPRFPWFGKEQVWVTLSLLAVLFGSMLPWWKVLGVVRVWGLDTWGMISLWGAALGLIGALSVRERWFRLFPLVGSVVAVVVILLVLTTGVSLPDGTRVCGPGTGEGCRPDFGLILTGAAAVNSALWAYRIRRAS